MKLVSATTGVDYGLIRQWKIQPWWLELEKEIRATQNIAVDNKLSKIIERSMEATLDRIENGEIRVDRKTKSTYREPVVAQVAAKVANDFLTRQAVLRKAEENIETVSTTSVVDQLKSLAIEFAKWSGKQNQTSQIIDVEVKEVEDAISEERETELQEGIGVGAQDSSESSEGTGCEEQSAFRDGESRESP
jgi:hypothetical protein